MATDKSEWTNLSRDNCYKSPLIVWNHDQKALYGIERKKLLKYSLDENAWTKYHDAIFEKGQTSSRSIFSYPYATVHSAGDKIFAFNRHGSILIVNINEFKFEYINDLIRTGTGAQGIMINNEFHVIGGYKSNQHLKWNEKNKKFEALHDLRKEINWNGIGHHCMVRIKHKILVFGGYNNYQHKYTNNVYEYDMITNKWRLMSAELPTRGICNMGCIAVLHEQYILLLGGDDFTHQFCDEIWIYSVRKQSFKKSSVKCPEKGPYQAFVVGDERNDQMAVFGYVRNEWCASKMADHLYPPEYLIRIMAKYYLNQEIHLFGYYFGVKHWKINVFDIFT